MAGEAPFRTSDITLWGVITLSIWAFAVIGANLSGIIPPGVYAALHASRLEGSTLNQLRGQVATLEQEAARMRRENNQLLQRFAMNEEAAGTVTRRVGALEVAVPKMLEEQRARISALTVVDPTATGSISAPSGGDKVVTFEADGGTVAVRQKPMLVDGEPAFTVVPLTESMPPAIPHVGEAAAGIGVALGFPVSEVDAEASWQSLLGSTNDALDGLSAVLSAPDASGLRRIVAGPALDQAAALALCDRLDAMGTPCEPAPFTGDPMPLLN